MSDLNIPLNYVLFNKQQSKNPVIVLKIAGVPDLLTNRILSTEIEYGDPIFYGEPGLVYGGLRPYQVINPDGSISTYRDYLDLDGSSLTISQRLEPEQGKASVATLSLAFIDKDQYMTKLISPGQILPEILLAECEVFLGFAENSYPQDFFRIFRGYVSSVSDGAGSVSIQISDANLKTRTSLFSIGNTELTADISPTDQIIPVVSNTGFFKQIVQPDGSPYNKSVHDYILIEDEWIEAEPLFQDNENYSVFVQGITYRATQNGGTSVSITYIGGGTAGAEVVTVVGNAITVQVDSGVSTATNVLNAVNQSSAALNLITPSLYPADAALVQVPNAQQFLTLQSVNGAVIDGLFYQAEPFHAATTITYSNTGTAGSETVTIVGFAITVHMQSGVSTAQNIYDALVNTAGVDTFVSVQLLAHAESIIQTAQGPVSLPVLIPGQQFAVVQRGARGTTAAAHAAADSTVASGIQIGDSVYQENAMDMALKLYLSGWNGPWISGVQIDSIGISNPDPQPGNPQVFVIQLPNKVDAVIEYGLEPGDYVTIAGSGTASNNLIPLEIVRFADYAGTTNRLIYVSTPLTKELVTTATVSFRSQFDQYPVLAGLSLNTKDVDVTQHEYIKNTFLSGGGNVLQFFIYQQESSGKDFIQTEVYFPIGAYGLTRYGKLSCGYNAPPIANQTVTVLNADNILNPQNIRVQRATNARTLFNEIDVSYGVNDQGSFTKVRNFTNSQSLKNMGGYTNVLPISSRGMTADYDVSLLNKYALFLLNRYAFGATIIPLDIKWDPGSLIEVGDIVLLDDSQGILQIANFQTGSRGLGQQLFNVIDRTFDIKNGFVRVVLQGNLGVNIKDRFATWSPSSDVDVGSTTTQVVIKDSYGALYPGNEGKKWQNYVGLPVFVHSEDYSVGESVILQAVDPINPYVLIVEALSFTPAAGYVVDIPAYSTSADPTVDQLYKLVHVHWDPTVFVVTGVDDRNFTVAGGDVSKFQVGFVLRMHNEDYSIDSGEVAVKTIVGTTITVDQTLGFTPSVGLQIDLLGFPDGGNPYRWI